MHDFSPPPPRHLFSKDDFFFPKHFFSPNLSSLPNFQSSKRKTHQNSVKYKSRFFIIMIFKNPIFLSSKSSAINNATHNSY